MSTPPLQPDDPRLTAYALGEADQTDRVAVETYLATSADARGEVEQTRAMAQVLRDEYTRQHDLYLTSRPSTDLPANVIAFSSVRPRVRQRSVVSMLKVAAMVALTASLVYLTVRRPHRPEETTVASSPPVERNLPTTPAAVASNQSDKDTAAAVSGEKKANPTQPTASDEPLPTESTFASAVSPDGPPVPRSAPADAEMADKLAEATSGGRAAGGLPKAAATPPPASRENRPPTLDAASAPAASTASHPAKPLTPEERIARSVVRIRSAVGDFFAGVLVSTDGSILAITSLPESRLQRPCTLFLSDERELSATAKPVEARPGWYWFLVNATGQPTVTLAEDAPVTDSTLGVVLVNTRTGATTFPSLSARSADTVRRAAPAPSSNSLDSHAEETFAFNSAGELLIIDQPAVAPLAAGRAKTKEETRVRSLPRVRPFTESERATLRRASK